jgi:hypothetical protein
MPHTDLHAVTRGTDDAIRTAAMGDMDAELYTGLPDFAEQHMERLYGNIYASPKQWRITGALSDRTGCYVEREGGEILAVIAFERRASEVRVLNEGHRFPPDLLERFARRLFHGDASIDMVTLHAVQQEKPTGYPSLAYECLEDIVLDLPASEDAYFAQLGGATRSYIKRYLNKLRKTFPAIRQEIITGSDISEADIRSLVLLNKSRMEAKGKTAGIDDEELRRIIALAKVCGLLSVLRYEGRIIAGTINFQAGNNFFLEVIAHDPVWNDYRVGTLCCYLTICECIRRGGREYHFLWGPHDYKFRLLGVERRLCHLTIYRSRTAMAIHPLIAAKEMKNKWRRKAQMQWRRFKESKSPIAAALLQVISAPRRGAGPAG